LRFEYVRRLDTQLEPFDVSGNLERLVRTEILEAVVPVRQSRDALAFELREQHLPNRAFGHLVQVAVAVEDVGQIEHLELAHAKRSELGYRGSEHLHRPELQRLHFLAVLVQLAVRIDLDLDAALGALLGKLLELLGALALRRIERDDVAELDDCGLLCERRAEGEHGRDRNSNEDAELHRYLRKEDNQDRVILLISTI